MRQTQFNKYMNPMRQILLHGVSPLKEAPTLWVWPVLTASYPECQLHPLVYQKPSRLNYNREHTQPTEGTLLEHLMQVVREIVPMGHTGHPMYKVIWPRLGDGANLPST